MSRPGRGDEAESVIDMREISGCTCLRVRRTARQLTGIYDRLLEPTGLTINQFGLLAHLHGAKEAGRPSLSMGQLAERVGMDPTTLNRSLKPLAAQRLVADMADLQDRRVRAVAITQAGRRRLADAVAPWRQAQARVESELGKQETLGLNGLLDRVAARLS
ncbi:DNA-binding transcriptional regulator, MarR family [Rhizobiales bacterium GAS191]|nr:DNA-binding transcriptional regulator, MarR family [Rhizobiales bacterium GAS191]SED22500.1 DNA-binding transcriptional regulator, MarR family [Rhizobiales bacterium GAS188]